jgi:hypothetical protein
LEVDVESVSVVIVVSLLFVFGVLLLVPSVGSVTFIMGMGRVLFMVGVGEALLFRVGEGGVIVFRVGGVTLWVVVSIVTGTVLMGRWVVEGERTGIGGSGLLGAGVEGRWGGMLGRGLSIVSELMEGRWREIGGTGVMEVLSFVIVLMEGRIRSGVGTGVFTSASMATVLVERGWVRGGSGRLGRGIFISISMSISTLWGGVVGDVWLFWTTTLMGEVIGGEWEVVV